MTEQTTTAQEALTEIILVNPKTKEAFAVPILPLAPHRLGILGRIRGQFQSTEELMEIFADMAEQDPSLELAKQNMTGTDEQKSATLKALENFVRGTGETETKRKVLISIFASQAKYNELERNMYMAHQYIVAMTDRKDFPKECKFDTKANNYIEEFWEAQNPKAVLSIGKFFRRVVEECLAEN